MMYYCPYCHRQLPPHAARCPFCGAVFSYAPPPPPKPSTPAKGLGITAMIFGILAICLPFVGVILALVGMILGFLARAKARKKDMTNGFGTAGVICSCVAFGYWMFVLFLMFLPSLLIALGIAGPEGTFTFDSPASVYTALCVFG